MVGFAEVLRVVICPVVFARAPVVPELFLVCAVSHPPVPHVRRFCRFGLKVPIDKTEGGSVVGLYGCGWLGVSQFFHGDPRWYCLS